MDGDAFTQHSLLLQSIFLGNVVSNTNTFGLSAEPNGKEWLRERRGEIGSQAIVSGGFHWLCV
jgi:hypothetical protein